jgi:hypothetical protein
MRAFKTGGQWADNCSCLPAFLFENDCIAATTDIADTTKTKFARHTIKTMLDMKMMTAMEVTEIMKHKEFRVS